MPTRVASASGSPKSRFSPPTAGAKATHQLWLSNPGMTWAQAAQARGIKPSSAMDDWWRLQSPVLQAGRRQTCHVWPLSCRLAPQDRCVPGLF